MPREDPCCTLQSYINFAMWTNRSAFTVRDAEGDSSLIQPHRRCADRPRAQPTNSHYHGDDNARAPYRRRVSSRRYHGACDDSAH
ncbi:hypothetical protein ROHU_021852 [Labeo rohita]|uniref:Uncharacterized protein n=1 Tax=Labeo rohita TaxID=84645 RepID=A0A498MT22_LABRO|nr:hypothetical protein ROHU_021852 [Labeo rohita]